MADIEYAGHTYRIATIDAMTQLHLARRLMPIMTALGGEDSGAALFQAVSAMSDAEFEYIVSKCLAGCLRITDDKPVKIYANGNLMFTDIGAIGMSKLTVATLTENLGDFFSGLRSGSLLPSL